MKMNKLLILTIMDKSSRNYTEKKKKLIPKDDIMCDPIYITFSK